MAVELPSAGRGMRSSLLGRKARPAMPSPIVQSNHFVEVAERAPGLCLTPPPSRHALVVLQRGQTRSPTRSGMQIGRQDSFSSEHLFPSPRPPF